MAKISSGHAKKLIENFKKDKIGKPYNTEETGIWFNRADIEAMFADVNGRKVHGVRFYLGAYENNIPGIPARDHEKGKITLVMVPTSDTLLTDPTGITYYEDLWNDPKATPEYDKEGDDMSLYSEGNDGQVAPPPIPE